MTPLQRDLAQQLQRAATEAGGRPVVYRTEYLGYLPFGQYQWVTVASEDISLACPDGWEWRDLESAGGRRGVSPHLAMGQPKRQLRKGVAVRRGRGQCRTRRGIRRRSHLGFPSIPPSWTAGVSELSYSAKRGATNGGGP